MTTAPILFAVRDPRARVQPGLAKAIQVARALGAPLELFHALSSSILVNLTRFDADAADKLREQAEIEARLPLLRLHQAVRKHRVEARHHVAWDEPAYAAIVRRAVAVGARLIIAECHRGLRTLPWLIHLTDWELLRTSPVPVLLLKSSKPYHRPLVLSAVDPAHAHAKPLALDSAVVAAANELGQALRGQVHVMHASNPSIVGLDPRTASQRAATRWSMLSLEELQQQERQAFEDFREREGIRRTRAHLVEGNPAVEIPRVAKSLKAGIVVMGGLSRSGLERFFIGNTSERVLQALTCDVLVIKPAKFAVRIRKEMRRA